MEEVWKREQAAAKEEQKLKDLQKQIAEERAREEMLSVAHAAGVKVRSDRLDWMYQGGVGARQEAEQRQAATGATLASITSDTGPQNADGGRAAAVAALPSFYSEDTPASANEMWQRLHADPLFAIKQQEVATRRNLLTNPVQMQAIKAQVKELKDLAKTVKSDLQKRHKSKEERHRKRHKRSPSPTEDGSRERPRRREEKESHWEESHRERRRRSREEDDDESSDKRRYHDRKLNVYEEERYNHRDSRDDNGRGYERRRSRSPRGRGERRSYDDRGRSYSHQERLPREECSAQKYFLDRTRCKGEPGAPADGRKLDSWYGISYGSHAPEQVLHLDRSDVAEATRQRLEEAARRDAEEKRQADEQKRNRHQRRDYQTGQLTEEERRRRLEAMTIAAQGHETERRARIQVYQELETREGETRCFSATFLLDNHVCACNTNACISTCVIVQKPSNRGAILTTRLPLFIPQHVMFSTLLELRAEELMQLRWRWVEGKRLVNAFRYGERRTVGISFRGVRAEV